jgi:hypothetical protein
MPTPIATSGIAQQAFRLIEQSPISSFGDDSEQAQAATEAYPEALEMCLEHADWSFASTPLTLVALTEASNDPELSFVFQRPADLLHVREFHPRAATWRLDADRIRADVPAPLWIRYTRRAEDESRMPAMFRTAVAYVMASLLAPRFTTSINRAAELADQGQVYLRRAARVDARNASGHRYDGLDRQGDWALMATAPGQAWHMP